MKLSAQQLAKYFDHTALKAETTAAHIETLCREAKQLGTAAVCVNAVWIPLATKLLRDTDVMPITVVGFPLGANGTESKVYEAKDSIAKGAKEIDMVLSVGELKSGHMDQARRDILCLKNACGSVPLKVIFETSLLTSDEIGLVTRWCAEDGIDFVKTSTGFGSRGASLEDIRIMKSVISAVPGSITKIKASGGIRTLEQTMDLISAGADRIGASATISIIAELSGGAAESKRGY
jgi:deoxyribose-phosphate aldolase